MSVKAIQVNRPLVCLTCVYKLSKLVDKLLLQLICNNEIYVMMDMGAHNGFSGCSDVQLMFFK